MLFVYAKNEQDDLTAEHQKLSEKIIESEK
jgi:hypothetical protein